MGKIVNKRAFFLFLISLFFSACVTTTKDISPAQTYRPRGAENLWRITGSLDNEFKQGFLNFEVKRLLHVYINGVEVITGQLSSRATGELTGQYQSHYVVSSCSSEDKTETWIEVRCMILIDNERVATLTF